jgi:hypothetical protein
VHRSQFLIEGGFPMRRNVLRALGALLLVGVLLVPLVATAHQTTTDAGYDIEYGWVNEPIIINQPNAVAINITKHAQVSASSTATATEAAPADVDVSGLVIQVLYGGQSKTLKLQPLGEDTPGKFVAPMMPTVAGLYTLQLSGKIDGNDIQTIQVQPEEANTPDLIQFPTGQDPTARLTASVAAAQSQAGTAMIVGIVGVVLGLVGASLGVYGLTRKSK